MAVRISSSKAPQTGTTILTVEGAMRLEDAGLLEDTCAKFSAEAANRIVIDLTGITFLDSDGASVLVRLKKGGITLTGLDFFVRSLIETAENQS